MIMKAIQYEISQIENEEIERIKAELADTVQSKRERIILMILGSGVRLYTVGRWILSAGIQFKSSEGQVRTTNCMSNGFLEHEENEVARHNISNYT
jgi:hypothetical protein